jgi:RNA polymerase sigma factor (sigma-70 family)
MRTLFDAGTVAGMTDGQLLDRFASRRGEAAGLAFAALVERHGGMVLRVCRRTLSDPDDAEDAFQTTFLVLAQKAGSIRNRDSIANWLHGVAHRVASGSRSAAARRRLHERRYADLAGPAVFVGREDDETLSAIHEEIERLPERYRAPVVLCDLEGLAYEQAARHLGCPAGTIKSRLARGREQLGERLRRRGLAPALGVIGPASRPEAAVPARCLIEATASAALRAAADCLTAGEVPAAVLSLATGALWMMRVNAWKRRAAACLLAAALTGSGIAAAAILARPGFPASAQAPAEKADPRPAAGAPKAEAEGRKVTYEVAFLEAPGLSLREAGFDFDYDLDPPAAVAFLSEVEMELLTRKLQATEGASVVPAPGVETPLEGRAVVVDPAGPGLPSGSADTRPPGPDDGPARGGRSDAGCTVRLEGQLSADERYLEMGIRIRDLHVVQVHAAEIGGGGGRRVEVPEVVRTDVDSTVTVPGSGAVLIGLGLSRTVDDAGASRIAERLVLIRPRGLRTPAALPDPAPRLSRVH